MTGIVRNQGHKLLCVNSVVDHVHIFFGMRPVQSLSDLMQDVKGSSSEWINRQRFINSRFEWQQGYGAFSYCRAEVPTVIDYIRNQREHHKTEPFLKEYRYMLKTFEIDYDEKYIFKEPI